MILYSEKIHFWNHVLEPIIERLQLAGDHC